MAELFIYSLKPRPAFARTAVKALQLRPSVTPEQGARVLQLCQGLQELILKIITDLPDNRKSSPRTSQCPLIDNLIIGSRVGFLWPDNFPRRSASSYSH